MKALLAAALLFALSCPAVAAESVYTDAIGKACADTGDSQGAMSRCPGPAGYAVVFTDEGNVVDARFGPRGHEKNLGGLQWSGGVDAKKVEWRIEGGHPVAAIFRLSKMNPETAQSHGFLAVARVTAQGGCLIEMVDAASSSANENARRVADARAGSFVCPK
jgi:hypothetical protein